MLGHSAVPITHQPGAGNADLPADANEVRQVIQVQRISAEIGITVDGYVGIKELSRERQRPSVGVNREYLLLKPCISNTIPILRRRYPQVDRPYLHAELASQEDRRFNPPAAQVEHAHPRLQVQSLAQPLSLP